MYFSAISTLNFVAQDNFNEDIKNIAGRTKLLKLQEKISRNVIAGNYLDTVKAG